MDLRPFASAVAAATILPRHVLGGPGFVAPSDKVNVAVIGFAVRPAPASDASTSTDDIQTTAVATSFFITGLYLSMARGC